MTLLQPFVFRRRRETTPVSAEKSGCDEKREDEFEFDDVTPHSNTSWILV
jgi:hypothetical protein